jgi:hypothetical protein
MMIFYQPKGLKGPTTTLLLLLRSFAVSTLAKFYVSHFPKVLNGANFSLKNRRTSWLKF